ncbi:MAG: thioredoxin-disulfide reductase [Patescibacteria group bacterium]
MPEQKIYDVVIIGAGPSGLTAAIYTVRRAYKTLVISKDIGGQMSLTENIENYPGFKQISGPILAQKMKEQAEGFGADFIFSEVDRIEKLDKEFLVATVDGQKVQARAVILSFGLTPRNLDVPGEKELTGRGVAYCATCDGPLYKDKDLVVVGGANAALDAAEYLSKLAKQVYILVRKDKFRGEQVLIDRVMHTENIKVIFGGVTKKIIGQNKVDGLTYLDAQQQEQTIKVDGVFIEIGHIAKTDWLKHLLNLNSNNEVLVSADNETSLPGIFAAGDLTQITYKQVVISAGEGAKAALQACKYLQGGKLVGPDWGK